MSRVYRPKDLAEALQMRADHPEAAPLAGGTDLMVTRHSAPREAYLNLFNVEGLSGIEVIQGGAIRVGAATIHRQIACSPEIQRAAPILAEAARVIGGRQIQNRGTLGGNIANASPAGDTLPVLLALDAQIEVQSAARGARLIPIEGFFKGYKQLDLAADELITAVIVPDHHQDALYFRKVGTRAAVAISQVILAGRVKRVEGRVIEARVAFGSVAPTPIRAREVEAALIGHPVDPRAADALDVHPIDDIRGTAVYRRAVAHRVLRTWLRAL
ncbi:xanthine dehydrogenase family protein subunit M [Myxococcota bacterium]|nr:xanthine dehydrogenase family protein subunit M [Myxococcota bacterium]